MQIKEKGIIAVQYKHINCFDRNLKTVQSWTFPCAQKVDHNFKSRLKDRF